MNIEKLYKYANSIAGDQGPDLLHHVWIELAGKEMQYPETYFYTVMKREYWNPDSGFNKAHRIHESASFPVVLDETQDLPKYDIFLLHKIFLELETEGYELEVNVYKECTMNTSVAHLSDETGIHRHTITKICNFVKSQIKKRYEFIESNNC